MEHQNMLSAILRWRGVLDVESKGVRLLVAGAVAFLCITPTFTQWGFVGLQFADGSYTYALFLLSVISLGAMLLGSVVGALTGFATGTVLLTHASLMPLDYYEYAFVTPATSVAMFTVCGIVLGVSFAAIMLERRGRAARALLIALACLVASAVLSAGCAALSGPQAREGMTFASVCVQVLVDAAIMFVAAIMGLGFAEQGIRVAGDSGLRAVFGSWLTALVLVAFMGLSIFAYAAITASGLQNATNDMRDEAVFLLDQVRSLKGQDDASRDTVSEELRTLFQGYSEEMDGLMAVVSDGVIIGADADRVPVGYSLAEAFDEDVAQAAEKSIASDCLECVIYTAPCQANDLVHIELPGTEDQFATLLTRQVGYLMAAEGDGYRVVMICPSSMVFASRDDVLYWVFLSSVVLLVSIAALTQWLLYRMVAKRIDATNAVLARITDGDLDAWVEPEGTKEFWDLAAGINVTVGTLKGSIAEAESRMDAELATARAIQESALPSVFPPYPDIRRFDIFASMNAAKEVGGDFYDLFLIGDDCGPHAGKLAFIMADVSGKGVPAALFMMKSKTIIRDYLESGMELGEAIENANRKLCEGNDEGMFVTAWIGVLDYATWHVDFVNAGHNPPLLWKAGGWTWVTQKSGLPLGLFDGFPYATFSLDCEVGDQFLLYTDGVTEAFSVDEEQYGEDRLLALMDECFTMHPRDLVDHVRGSVAAYAEGAEQSDDITILALEVGVPPEEKAQITVVANADELERVTEFLHAELDRRLCPMRIQMQLDIAVEELFVNSCHYAYEGLDDSVERYVRITYSYSADPVSITVEIIDDGVPFDPLAKPEAATADDYDDFMDIPAGGLGIFMAKKNVDEIRYERAGDSNVVTLVKSW